ncbi:hypothetical protein KPATCC21470_3652 [Kitasatospora purpeofusca]
MNSFRLDFTEYIQTFSLRPDLRTSDQRPRQGHPPHYAEPGEHQPLGPAPPHGDSAGGTPGADWYGAAGVAALLTVDPPEGRLDVLHPPP